MATRRSAPRTSVTKTNGFSACLSPPLWKDQLRQRCLARLKQNRHELLVKLRSPDANIADEMKRLVFKEEKRKMGGSGARHLVFDEPLQGAEPDERHDGELVTIEDLMVSGQLSEQDYLDIVHSLEDELRNDWDADDEDERFAEEMIEFEEASLAAMLAGMDLDGPSGSMNDHPYTMAGDDAAGWDNMVDGTDGVPVLCPICKVDSLSETPEGASHAVVSCSCGFSLRVKQHILHGALEDLQEKISDAYMAHREECPVDPTFAVFSDLDDDYEVTDSLLMSCGTCGHECLVR